jgi:PPM family protein phosphatase
MTDQPTTCPRCGANVEGADRFCESCGAIVAEVRRVAIPREVHPLEGQVPDRDEAQLGRIALITDRGLAHASNEDAAAAGMMVGNDPGRPYAIAVAVCDGVSTSGAAHLAAVAASKAGMDAMLAALAASRTTRAAVLAGLADAAKAAAAAGTDADPSSPPSCTYTAAAVVPTSEGAVQITVGNVGDSRAYWLPEPPLTAQQLTVDDSLAQELITAGATAESEAVRRGAHTLTRWLGADSEPQPWSDAGVQTITATGPGSLLVCSDGLWNYLPDPADIARLCTGIDSTAAARALVDHALHQGGHDNVTVAVIPIGGPHEFD